MIEESIPDSSIFLSLFFRILFYQSIENNNVELKIEAKYI